MVDQRIKLMEDRSKLLELVAPLELPIRIRPLEDFHLLDDSVLYAQSETRDLIVCVLEDVTWGPEISSYVEEADEYRALSCLRIDVPNRLAGRESEVLEMISHWFG